MISSKERGVHQAKVEAWMKKHHGGGGDASSPAEVTAGGLPAGGGGARYVPPPAYRPAFLPHRRPEAPTT